MKLYHDIFYPLKKRLTGEDVQKFNLEYWDRYANLPDQIPIFFDRYTKTAVHEHWEIIQKYLKERKVVVVDVGCSIGNGLKNYQIEMEEMFLGGIGIDISENILKIAKTKNPSFDYYQKDLTIDLKEDDPLIQRGDLLVCHSILHSIPKKNLPIFFHNIKKILKPKGIAFFAWWAPYFVDEQWLISFLPNSHRHRERVVINAMKPYFHLLPFDLKAKGSKENKGEGLLANLRKGLKWFHPRENGIIIGRANS